jgi:hypothetical protein
MGFVRFCRDMRRILSASYGDSFPAYDAQIEPWKTVASKIKSLMPGGAALFLRYLNWSFGDYVEEVDEPGSRPPVGKHAPHFPRRAPAGRGGSAGGPPREREGRPNRDRPNGSAGGPPKRGRDADRGGGRPTKDLAAAVTRDVLSACKQLRADKSVDTIKLAPQNSFYRRVQHSCVSEEGFYSFSDGEGALRSVVVTRNPVAGKDTP